MNPQTTTNTPYSNATLGDIPDNHVSNMGDILRSKGVHPDYWPNMIRSAWNGQPVSMPTQPAAPAAQAAPVAQTQPVQTTTATDPNSQAALASQQTTTPAAPASTTPALAGTQTDDSGDPNTPANQALWPAVGIETPPAVPTTNYGTQGYLGALTMVNGQPHILTKDDFPAGTPNGGNGAGAVGGSLGGVDGAQGHGGNGNTGPR